MRINRKQMPKQQGKITKTQKAIMKAKEKQAKYAEQAKADKAKLTRIKNRDAARRNSSNPITRKLAQAKEASIKKQEVKLRKLEADAKMAEQDPKLAALKSRTENKVKIEKAKASGKIGAYTAVASGAARLGKGLSDENNQDDAAERRAQQQALETIFNSGQSTGANSGDTGLAEGVI